MKLLDRVHEVATRRHLSPLTIECYQRWIRDFLRFSRLKGAWRSPAELHAPDVEKFLTHLALQRHLSASTQNQATNAIVFLYKHVLADELPTDHLGRFAAERSRRPARIPTVLSDHEVMRIIDEMPPASPRTLMVRLLYGTGLRVMELCTLRLRDLDFDRRQIIVRGGKGDKDRIVMMPAAVLADVTQQTQRIRKLHIRDLARGGGHVPLPPALSRKVPYAEADWRWQFLFPSVVMREDERGHGVRWHADPGVLDKFIRAATLRAGVSKRVTCHTFRHSFATHLLEAGYDIRQVQTLLGHADVKTTMIYTHVMNKPATAVTSPLDRLADRESRSTSVVAVS
jgi:integron integrase